MVTDEEKVESAMYSFVKARQDWWAHVDSRCLECSVARHESARRGTLQEANRMLEERACPQGQQLLRLGWPDAVR